MAKSEPSLVPEWLKSSSGLGGHGGSYSQQGESGRGGLSSRGGLSASESSHHTSTSRYGSGAYSGGGFSRLSGGNGGGDWHDYRGSSASHSSHGHPRFTGSSSYRGYDSPGIGGGSNSWGERERDRDFGTLISDNRHHRDGWEQHRSQSLRGDSDRDRSHGNDDWEQESISAASGGSPTVGVRPYQPPNRRYEEAPPRGHLGSGRAGNGVSTVQGNTDGRTDGSDSRRGMGDSGALQHPPPFGGGSRLSERVAFDRNFPSLGDRGAGSLSMGAGNSTGMMSPRYLRPIVSPRGSGRGSPLLAPVSALVSPGPVGSSSLSSSHLTSSALVLPPSAVPSDSTWQGGNLQPLASGTIATTTTLNGAGAYAALAAGNGGSSSHTPATVSPSLKLVNGRSGLQQGLSPREVKRKARPARLTESSSALVRSSSAGSSSGFGTMGSDRLRSMDLRTPDSGRSSPAPPSPGGTGVLVGASGGGGGGSTSHGSVVAGVARARAPTNGVGGGAPGSHAHALGTEEKRLMALQSQNRSDFFNALRKKTAGEAKPGDTEAAASAGVDRGGSKGGESNDAVTVGGSADLVPGGSSAEKGGKEEGGRVDTLTGTVPTQGNGEDVRNVGKGGGRAEIPSSLSLAEAAKNGEEAEGGKVKQNPVNGEECTNGIDKEKKEGESHAGASVIVANGNGDGNLKVAAATVVTAAAAQTEPKENWGPIVELNFPDTVSRMQKAQEEEISFLRSLGWEEREDEEGEEQCFLTQEEINDFRKVMNDFNKDAVSMQVKMATGRPARTFSQLPIRRPQSFFREEGRRSAVCTKQVPFVVGSVDSVSSSDSDEDVPK